MRSLRYPAELSEKRLSGCAQLSLHQSLNRQPSQRLWPGRQVRLRPPPVVDLLEQPRLNARGDELAFIFALPRMRFHDIRPLLLYVNHDIKNRAERKL